MLERLENALCSRKAPLYAALIALVLTLPSLGQGFMADDYIQRAVMLQPEPLEGLFGDSLSEFFSFTDGDPERMERLVDLGVYPWMTDLTLRIRFWRPLTVATHWFDFALWPDSPFLMHVHNLFWFALMVAAAGLFYRDIMGVGMTAGLAAILFAVDDAHAWPAAWIANRNAVVALCLGLFALMLHHRSRSQGNRWAAVLAVALFAAALFAKESTVAVLGYLFAYCLFLDSGSYRSRIASLIPYGVVTVAWRWAYVALDYGAQGSDGYVDPFGAPLLFAKAALSRIPILLQSQWVVAPADVLLFAPPWLSNVMTVSAWIVVVILAVVLVPLLRRDATARFWCLGMVLAAVPLAAASPQDRLLMFPGLGAMGLLAQLLVSLRSGAYAESGPVIPKATIRPVQWALTAVHLVFAPILLPLTIVALGFMMSTIDRLAMDGLPRDEEVRNQTFILANSANYPVGSYVYVMRGLENIPAPKHLRSFAPVSMAAVPIEITRTDERTIVARPDGGYPWSVFRSSKRRFAVGDTVSLSGMTAEVTELADDREWPTEIRYRFEKSLDDPSYRWFRINGMNYEPMPVPAIGATIRLEPIE